MPRPPGSDPDMPVRHCPQCGQTLTFHNIRTERTADAKVVPVVVYLCIRHGFYRTIDNGPIGPGM